MKFHRSFKLFQASKFYFMFFKLFYLYIVGRDVVKTNSWDLRKMPCLIVIFYDLHTKWWFHTCASRHKGTGV